MAGKRDLLSGGRAKLQPKLQLIFDTRMANDSRPFRFMFNSSSKASANLAGAEHMKIESLAAKLVAKSGGRLKARFISGSSLRII